MTTTYTPYLTNLDKIDTPSQAKGYFAAGSWTDETWDGATDAHDIAVLNGADGATVVAEDSTGREWIHDHWTVEEL
ncbi:MAG: hypothetical protein LBJ44_05820 [Propionibacteriaceae bacterium]|jgi:hypothetical protein|nr:hypothetical protein [Propionibacteriaceae bacterium]